MKLVPHQHAFLCDLAKFIQFVDNTGVMVTAGELKRTDEQQALYVATGKSDTLNGMHLKSLGIELNFFIGGQLTYDVDKIRPYGIFWKNLNPLNRWGGDFKMKDGKTDAGHFERHI